MMHQPLHNSLPSAAERVEKSESNIWSWRIGRGLHFPVRCFKTVQLEKWPQWQLSLSCVPSVQSQRWQPQPCLPSPSSSGLFSSHSERRAHPEEKLISFLLSPSFLDRSIPWSVLLSPGSWLGCNHKVIWVGRGFKGHPNLLHGHLPLDQGAPSNLAWNVSRDGESTTPSQKLSPSHLLLPYPITTGPTKSLSPIHKEAVIPIYKGILFYWKSRKRNRGVISLKIST